MQSNTFKHTTQIVVKWNYFAKKLLTLKNLMMMTNQYQVLLE